MAHYVDGFVVPVPLRNLDAYRRMAEQAGKIWMEHGALQYWECIGDDVKPGKVTSFPQSVQLKDDEIVVFAWFLYPTLNAGTSLASQAFWQVDDVEREVAELKARGVEFEDYDMPGEKSPSGVVTADGAKAAWFKDSEGNILAIIQNA